MDLIYDILVIGGGPGGIGVAVESKILGIEKVLLVEKSDNHSQTIRKFYKDQKRVDKDWQGQSVALDGNIDFFDGTKESTIDYFDLLLDNHLIDAKFNCEVDKVIKMNDIFEVYTNCGNFLARNVVIGVGRMGKPNKPSYTIPPSLKTQVNFNLDKCGNNENILVVGGGDSAVEYACELSQSNKVTLCYRGANLTRPNPTNIEMFDKFVSEKKLTPKLGIDIESLENEHGKVKVIYTDGKNQIFDRVIYALGGTTPVDFLKKCSVSLDEKGEPIFDENYETKIEGLFIAGDIAFRSGGSIAIALNHGYRIVTHILNKD
ncbi:MAG: NAD(P)-binding domain-containing protein [Campylobacterales bacterium]|nr:NAD(P)-binding domain-containing protein [Campylobacterales bacterium]